MNKVVYTNLGALDLQLHVVLARRFPVFPLFPAVAVPAIAHFLSAVEQHASALGPATDGIQISEISKQWRQKPFGVRTSVMLELLIFVLNLTC
jgi:hypothetical protein